MHRGIFAQGWDVSFSFRSARLVVCLFGCVFFSGLSQNLATENSPRPPWTTSHIKGRPTPPDPFRVELAFPGLSFQRPTCVCEIPGTHRLLVTEQAGKIFSFDKSEAGSATALICDLAEAVRSEVSIKDLTFHPDFQTNRQLYLCYGRGGQESFVSMFRLKEDASALELDASSEVVLLRWPWGGHGGGCLRFGPDGMLYISSGDGSGPTPPDLLNTGQDVSDLLGAVLRIDVDQADGETPYSIPADNPFVDVENARPEIWAYGLRNPWKFGIDSKTGSVFVADNGWETWEMIHLLQAGSNCGWPIMEGRARLRTDIERGPTPITPPIKDHPHSEANSVIGGPVYRGSTLPGLDGWFVYGDYITGTVWGLALQADGQLDHQTLADSDLHIVDFAEGSQGEIYVLDFDQTGQLYRLVPSDEPDTSSAFPRRLSQTGLFRSLETLEPAMGVVPYQIATPQWMDGAVAKRWVAIPGTHSISMSATELIGNDFPDDTVLVKHVELPATDHSPTIRLETQILHRLQGTWNPYSYQWDDGGHDAHLADAQGADRSLQNPKQPGQSRTWHVASINECRLCHSAGSGFVLGFNARQLDIALPRKGESKSVMQLDFLSDLRVLLECPKPAENLPKFVDPLDSTQSLSDRARSYLHANCGVCHNRQGPATISFYAHRDYALDELNITKRPGIGHFDIPSPQLLAPGQPYRSIILYRMSKLGYGRMPYVGSRMVDSRGVELIKDWILSLASADARTQELAADLNAGRWNEGSTLSERLASTDAALALSIAMHSGRIPNDMAQAITDAASASRSDVRGLFEHFVPESERRKTLGTNPNKTAVLDLMGDPERGELIFFSDDARCRTCHHVQDPLQSLGPTLAEIRVKYQQAHELLAHVIEPSTRIDEKFKTWSVLTTGGTVYSGLLVSNDQSNIQLRLADKKNVIIQRADIEDIKQSERSLMPDGTLADLTPQEAADLLSFLMKKETPQ